MPRAGGDAGDSRSEDGDRKETRLSLRLPPFRLPRFFPPDFELRFPIPGGPSGRRIGARTLLVACILFDVLDAILAITVGVPIVGAVRAFGGLALAATVGEFLGLLYGWELLAVLVGWPELTVFPTLTVLLVFHARG